MTIHGVAFVGDANADNEATIAAMGGVRRLGRLPFVAKLDHASLAAGFAANFCTSAFA